MKSGRKAAIVIGVNKTGELPALSAAVTGAQEFAAWAKDQGWEVKTLTDSAKRGVTIAAIKRAVLSFVKSRTYSQLLIYFAGHGILKGPNYEIWLLSGAPGDPDEAVNVSGSLWQARNARIPHIVFVSDACRSNPNTMLLAQINGGIIFPNQEPRSPTPAIDQFYATLPGNPAIEAPPKKAAKAYRGIFTDCFLKGLRGQVKTVIEHWGEIVPQMRVVPSWKLGPYLESEVPKIATRLDIKLDQNPMVIAESRQPFYLSRLKDDVHAVALADASSGLTKIRPGMKSAGDRPTARPGAKKRAPTPTIAPPGQQPKLVSKPRVDVLRQFADHYQLSRFFGPRDASQKAPRRDQIHDARFHADMDVIMRSKGRVSFETTTGFTVVGQAIARALVPGTVSDVFAEQSTGGDNQIRIHSDRTGGFPSGLVLIQFANGSGARLAVLPGFIGTIVVEDNRIVNVSYTPAQNTNRYRVYRSQEPEIEKRRAFAAVASRRGYFRIDPEQAAEFRGYLRELKALDPTLGLYSAYGYAQAGLARDVNSVYGYMAQDNIPMLFDVALLSGKLSKESLFPHPPRVAPDCPLLTQGWALLGEQEELLDTAVRKAGRWLVPSLWTTFRREGIELLWKASGKGRR
jgi:hypothetical protein